MFAVKQRLAQALGLLPHPTGSGLFAGTRALGIAGVQVES